MMSNFIKCKLPHAYSEDGRELRKRGLAELALVAPSVNCFLEKRNWAHFVLSGASQPTSTGRSEYSL